MLNDIDQIEGLTPEQIEAINEKARGLVDKNKSLLDKLSKTKEVKEQSVAEVEALRQFKENADIKEAEDRANWEETKALMQQKHESELLKIKDSETLKDQQLKKLLIDDGLNRALDAAKVDPRLKAGAEAMLREKVQLSDGKALVGEASLSDYVKEWSESETGKAFCLAPENSGGGGGGSDGRTHTEGSPESNLNSRLKAKGLI